MQRGRQGLPPPAPDLNGGPGHLCGGPAWPRCSAVGGGLWDRIPAPGQSGGGRGWGWRGAEETFVLWAGGSKKSAGEEAGAVCGNETQWGRESLQQVRNTGYRARLWPWRPHIPLKPITRWVLREPGRAGGAWWELQGPPGHMTWSLPEAERCAWEPAGGGSLPAPLGASAAPRHSTQLQALSSHLHFLALPAKVTIFRFDFKLCTQHCARPFGWTQGRRGM